MAIVEKMEKGRVCVTGGTGYLGSWLIQLLLHQGYSVNTTIRSPSNPGKKKNISYLKDLPGASERLQIFNASFEKPESFAPAIQGCIGVFHVAHPIDHDSKESEESKVRISVNGTLGVLQACLDSKTVKRIIYTSSAATILYNDMNLDSIDESVWSDVDFVRKNDQMFSPYFLTKIFAEKAALEFAEKNGLDLVSLIPSWIHGPFNCPNFPGSMRTCMAMIFGDEEYYSCLLKTSYVHTDDVARAHVFLFENPDAKGRYICSAVDITLEKLSECLSAKYPNQYPIPSSDSLKGIEGFVTADLSSKKLMDLGFKFKYGIEEIFDDAIECCKQKGFL